VSGSVMRRGDTRGEAAEDWSAVNLVVGEVDHRLGVSFYLDRGELPERAVWPLLK
jgi:hypothetical protein